MINSVVLMGRLTADPELKNTNSGIEVCSFSVAVERPYKNENGEKQTDFINVTAWRQNAAFISKYFRKGQMIAIEGSIQTRSYEDKNGNKRTAFEVVVDRASFCGGKSDSTTVTAPAGTVSTDVSANEDDLPF